MVKFFKSYTLGAGELTHLEQSIGTDDCEVELDDLMREFDPEGDPQDAIMMYLLTGKEMNRVMKDWIKREGEDDMDAETPRSSVSVTPGRGGGGIPTSIQDRGRKEPLL